MTVIYRFDCTYLVQRVSAYGRFDCNTPSDLPAGYCEVALFFAVADVGLLKPSLILRRSEVARSYSEGVRASDLGPSENQVKPTRIWSLSSSQSTFEQKETELGLYRKIPIVRPPKISPPENNPPSPPNLRRIFPAYIIGILREQHRGGLPVKRA